MKKVIKNVSVYKSDYSIFNGLRIESEDGRVFELESANTGFSGHYVYEAEGSGMRAIVGMYRVDELDVRTLPTSILRQLVRCSVDGAILNVFDCTLNDYRRTTLSTDIVYEINKFVDLEVRRIESGN